jgi:hypothetical protein
MLDCEDIVHVINFEKSLKKALTVGKLKKALENVSDDTIVSIEIATEEHSAYPESILLEQAYPFTAYETEVYAPSQDVPPYKLFFIVGARPEIQKKYMKEVL